MNAAITSKSSFTVSPRQIALVAGISSLVMFVAAIFGEFYSRQGLIVPGDAQTTAINVVQHHLSMRLGIFCFLLILVCDVLVSWAFYVLLKEVNREISLLAAFFRLMYTAVFAVAIFYLVQGFNLLYSTSTPATAQQAMESFAAFDTAWSIGFVFFGFHLLFVGYLIYRSGTMPRILGILLLLASVAYLVNSFAQLLLPQYETYADVLTIAVAAPSVTGELGFAIWLLVKGGKQKNLPV